MDTGSTILLIVFSVMGLLLVVYQDVKQKQIAAQMAADLERTIKENAIKKGIADKSLDELVADANKRHRDNVP